jgi:hypothetical protein
MSVNHTSAPSTDTVAASPEPPAKPKRRTALAAALVLSGGVGLAGLFGAGVAQAAPVPAPQHFGFEHFWCPGDAWFPGYFNWDWNNCHWDSYDWSWDHDHHYQHHF